MNFLGLDLSFTATGFYMIRDGAEALSFEIDTKPADFGTDIERADHIARAIVEKIGDVRPEMILIEDYYTGKQPGSVIKLAVLGTVVRVRLLEAGHSFVTLTASQIKKLETGKGVAPKDTMVKSVFKRHGFDTNSNNVADACAMAYAAKAFYEWQNGRRDFLKYETEVLRKAGKEREVTVPYDVRANPDAVRIRKI